MAFEVGRRVESRYKGKSKYYPGKISKIGADGTYDVDYDDGEKENGVAFHLLAPHSERGAFKAGQAVHGGFGGKPRYFPGTIASDNGDGSYEVLYADGDSEKSTLLVGAAASGVFQPGEAVVALAGSSGGKSFYPGRVVVDNGNGTYVVNFDDGDVDKEASFILSNKRCAPAESSIATKLSQSIDLNRTDPPHHTTDALRSPEAGAEGDAGQETNKSGVDLVLPASVSTPSQFVAAQKGSDMMSQPGVGARLPTEARAPKVPSLEDSLECEFHVELVVGCCLTP